MTLRRKLLVAYLSLAAIAMLVTGVAFYLTLTWQSTTEQLEQHYQRSLLLQRIRAGTFQALKEVDDALTGEDYVDARQDFERALAPTQQDFQDWEALADRPEEQAELKRVLLAQQALVAYARQALGMLPHDRARAIELVDDRIDTRAYEQFRALTEEGVQADRLRRREIAAQTAQVRTTTQVMLAISATSTLSLALLLAAFLMQDLSAALRHLGKIVDRLRAGDYDTRADASRGDELGFLAASLNSLAEELAQSQGAVASRPIAVPQRDLAAVDLPLLVHRLLAHVGDELASRSTALELDLPPELRRVAADKARLEGALQLLMRAALQALPPEGGRLGLRARTGRTQGRVCLELAHDGHGAQDRQEAADCVERARLLIEQQGGTLTIVSEPAQGWVAQVGLAQWRALPNGIGPTPA